MTKEERTIIEYRLKRSYEAIEEAKLLFETDHINSYVNRLYYACFYAVSALLLTKNISTSKHGQLRSLLHREFVKTGLISYDLGKHFDLLFNSLQKSDYFDLVEFKADDVAGWMSATNEFVIKVENIILKLL